MEEAEELCDAKTKDEVAFEAADLFYFALTKAVSAGVSLADIERNLDAKSVKVKRRQGDAKGQWAAKEGISNSADGSLKETVKEVASVPKAASDPAASEEARIMMKRYNAATISPEDLQAVLQRP